jgi:uncharacterized membrane protein (UPF0127 family)
VRRLASLLLMLLLLAACGQRGAPVVPPQPEPEPPRVAALPDASLLLVAPGARTDGAAIPVVEVEVAATYAARQRGLGGRETLADGAGMLFVYPDTDGRRFWMKDCLIALDIAFLDEEGRVLHVATLAPGAGLSSDEIPSVRHDGPVRYVLEVRARWLSGQGIGVGDVVDVRHVVEDVVPE